MFLLQIIFRAIRGETQDGDVAIDDITFNNTICSVSPTAAILSTVDVGNATGNARCIHYNMIVAYSLKLIAYS
jgi:hypothetical protein